MPTGVLKFDLPKENNEFELATKAQNLLFALSDFDQDVLRQYQKYGHDFETADEILNDIRKRFFEILKDREIKLDLLI